MPFRPDRLKQLRLRKGYTQQDLADAVKMTQAQIARWENGNSEPLADAVAQLARVIGCTTDWLLGLAEQPQGYARPPELSIDEQRLIELYRQDKLPEMISRLVSELSARAQPQTDLKVDRPN